MKLMKIVYLLCMGAIVQVNAAAQDTESFLKRVEKGEPVAYMGDNQKAGEPTRKIPGQAVFIPSTGLTISLPGKYFVGDVPPTFAPGVNPITITADNVELDLNGFTIMGSGTGTGDSGILVSSADNVVIKNGTIRSITGDGVKIIGSKYTLVEDLFVLSSSETGFLVDTGSEYCLFRRCRSSLNTDEGFLDDGSVVSTFQHCLANNNSGSGFNMRAGAFCLEDSIAQNNSSGGIIAFNVNNGVIRRNCSIANSANGIFIGGTSTHISVCENEVIGSTSIGIRLSASTTQSCQIIDNKVVNNATSSAAAAGIDIGGGVFLAGAAGATARSHEVFGNYAKNNGNNPADKNALGTDTNYSNDVQASPNGVPAAPNGLVTTPAAGAGRLQNITT